MTFGIDSLYYFCISNDEYDNLYLDIIDQMDRIKGKFEIEEIAYTPNDINITISETTLVHLGFSEGYLWLKDINNFFKIGFKDENKNRGLHNIRVQLLGEGIYTIGIKSLINYIDKMLKGNIETDRPLTRADINCFIEYDFSFVAKNMFVTKKRAYSVITEIGNADKIETLYVGKNPFKLRLYNKTNELKKSKKQELMREFFLNNGFNINNTIFNVEFEMHRSHLKAYNILTVEELFKNANNLFKQSMDDIRLIDIKDLKQGDTKNKNKNRASTLPIWKHIKENFDIKEFLQVKTPLKRIKRAVSIYDYNHFKDEFILLLRKAYINSISISRQELDNCMSEFVDSLEVKNKNRANKYFIDVEITNKDKTKEKFRWLKSGELIKPINVISVSDMSDHDLKAYLNDITSLYGMSEDDNYKYEIAYNELVKRGLKEPIVF